MFYIYWQKNIKAPIKLQTDGIKDLTEALKQAVLVAKRYQKGSVIILNAWGYMPEEMWTMGLLQNYRMVSHKNAKAYLPDYEQVIRNGKRYWTKINLKQERLFD
jgi:hypothetical protein